VFLIRFLGEKPGGGCHLYQHPKLGSAVNVSAGQATSIQTGQSGEIRLGSKRTKYEVRSPDAEGSSANTPTHLLVFEGEVEAHSRSFSLIVNAGKKLETETDSRGRIRDLNEKDFLQSAQLLARIDVSQAFNLIDLEAAFKKLVDLYREMLKQPGNKAKARALKKGQLELGLADLVLNVKSGANGTANILFVNRCLKPINVSFAIENLPYARFVTAADRSIIPGVEIKTSLEFDTAGLQPGRYSGVVTASCVNCSKQKCLMERQEWTVVLNVQ
jgi:hypothetical protein